MKRKLLIARNAIFGLLVLYALFIILTSIGLFGGRAYVVRSGSMSPKIGVGALVFDSKSSHYKIGDVITFHRAGFTDPVTHRIVKISKGTAGKPVYTVKGDANTAADSQTVKPGDIIGKVNHSIPYIGYADVFIKTLPGLLICILIPAVIIVYHEVLSIAKEVTALKIAKTKSKSRRSKAIRLSKLESQKQVSKIVASILFLVLLGLFVAQTSSASLSDQVTATRNSVTAAPRH